MSPLAQDLFKMVNDMNRINARIYRPVVFPADFNPPQPSLLTDEELAEMELEFRGRELDAELAAQRAIREEPPV